MHGLDLLKKALLEPMEPPALPPKPKRAYSERQPKIGGSRKARSLSLVANYLSDKFLVEREPSSSLNATKRYLSSIRHFQQAVFAVSQIQNPQEVHLTRPARLLLPRDRPI